MISLTTRNASHRSWQFNKHLMQHVEMPIIKFKSSLTLRRHYSSGPRSTTFERKKRGPEVIKLFFILNSAEHEIYPAHKC